MNGYHGSRLFVNVTLLQKEMDKMACANGTKLCVTQSKIVQITLKMVKARARHKWLPTQSLLCSEKTKVNCNHLKSVNQFESSYLNGIQWSPRERKIKWQMKTASRRAKDARIAEHNRQHQQRKGEDVTKFSEHCQLHFNDSEHLQAYCLICALHGIMFTSTSFNSIELLNE